MKQVLVIEDDEMLNAGICYNLEAEGIMAQPVYTCKEAKEQLKIQSWELIILDVTLPDGDGFQFFQYIRSLCKTPVIFVTAKDLDEDILKGFELGAEDYITKPFKIKIFIQKVKAIMRRCGDKKIQEKFLCGNLEIDFEARKAKKNGCLLEFTPTEFKLLYILAQNPGQVLTRASLLEAIWDINGNFVEEHALTIQISRLRSKIQDSQYSYIKTIYGLGYQWIGDKIE